MSRTTEVLLQKDLEELKRDDDYDALNLRCLERQRKGSSKILKYWSVTIDGAVGSYWERQKYEVEIHFSLRHPYEAPLVIIPPTERNQMQLKHPNVSSDGIIRTGLINKDVWTCTTTVIDIINYLRRLFSKEFTFLRVKNDDTAIQALPKDVLHHCMSYLDLDEIASTSSVNKRLLVLSRAEEFWAELWYKRCRLSNTLLYSMPNAGPLRVYSMAGTWYWRDARHLAKF